MPKSLFFTIPEPKREKILDAAMAEFSQYAFHEASINRITAAAGIARGSFYQYFTDKEDVYFHLLERIVLEDTSDFTLTDPLALKGDPFRIHRELFRYNLGLLGHGRYRPFISNVFLTMDYRFAQRHRQLLERRRAAMVAHLGIPDTTEEQRVAETLSVLAAIARDLLAEKVFLDLSDAEIMATYHRRLALLGIHFDDGPKK